MTQTETITYNGRGEGYWDRIETLTRELYATGIHGQTGQPVDEGYLDAGTQIRHVERDENGFDNGEPAWFFEASTDGGENWYRHHCYQDPSLYVQS